MAIIGKVESLWRYPVKSMRGEELSEAFIGFAGVYGDRLFAFRSAGRPSGFPYLTGREQMKMVLYRPRFRHPDKAAKPPNVAEAESIEPGLSPIFADPADLAVDVETPSGEVLSVNDPNSDIGGWFRCVGLTFESGPPLVTRVCLRGADFVAEVACSSS